MIRAIVALDKNAAIGCKGRLLVHVPDDLAHFKRATLNGIVVMGRKTYESIPGGKGLPQRENWVLSRSGKVLSSCICFSDFETLLCKIQKEPEREYWIIGGEEIYRLFWPYYDELLITYLDYEAPEADAYFPDPFNQKGWFLQNEEKFVDRKTGIPFVIRSFQREKNIN